MNPEIKIPRPESKPQQEVEVDIATLEMAIKEIDVPELVDFIKRDFDQVGEPLDESLNLEGFIKEMMPELEEEDLLSDIEKMQKITRYLEDERVVRNISIILTEHVGDRLRDFLPVEYLQELDAAPDKVSMRLQAFDIFEKLTTDQKYDIVTQAYDLKQEDLVREVERLKSESTRFYKKQVEKVTSGIGTKSSVEARERIAMLAEFEDQVRLVNQDRLKRGKDPIPEEAILDIVNQYVQENPGLDLNDWYDDDMDQLVDQYLNQKQFDPDLGFQEFVKQYESGLETRAS